MTDRVLDFSREPARLSIRNGLLVVETDGEERAAIPCDEIAAVITSHRQISFSQSVLGTLAGAGAILVACNEKQMPVAMLMPLAAHHAQAERFLRQTALGLPSKKRLWQAIVRAKIRAQADVLERATGGEGGLRALVAVVKSGDSGNTEARAARRYWSLLFGEEGPRFFRSNPDDPRNGLLNYGYAVLRAVTARALCGCGLHPTFGLKHGNVFNAFPLADDIMEPFRPRVDWAARNLSREACGKPELNTTTKTALIEAVMGRVEADGEDRTMPDVILRVCQSLARTIMGEQKGLWLPQWKLLEEGKAAD